MVISDGSQLIGERNEQRYVLATQDAGLRKWAQKIPGLPVLSLIHGTLSLAKASPASIEAAAQVVACCVFPPIRLLSFSPDGNQSSVAPAQCPAAK